MDLAAIAVGLSPIRKFRVSPVTGAEPNRPRRFQAGGGLPHSYGVDDIEYTPKAPYWGHNVVFSGGITL